MQRKAGECGSTAARSQRSAGGRGEHARGTQRNRSALYTCRGPGQRQGKTARHARKYRDSARKGTQQPRKAEICSLSLLAELAAHARKATPLCAGRMMVAPPLWRCRGRQWWPAFVVVVRCGRRWRGRVAPAIELLCPPSHPSLSPVHFTGVMRRALSRQLSRGLASAASEAAVPGSSATSGLGVRPLHPTSCSLGSPHAHAIPAWRAACGRGRTGTCGCGVDVRGASCEARCRGRVAAPPSITLADASGATRTATCRLQLPRWPRRCCVWLTARALTIWPCSPPPTGCFPASAARTLRHFRRGRAVRPLPHAQALTPGALSGDAVGPRVPQPAGPCRRVRQGRGGRGGPSGPGLWLRGGWQRHAAAAIGQPPPSRLPPARPARRHQPLRLQQSGTGSRRGQPAGQAQAGAAVCWAAHGLWEFWRLTRGFSTAYVGQRVFRRRARRAPRVGGRESGEEQEHRGRSIRL